MTIENNFVGVLTKLMAEKNITVARLGTMLGMGNRSVENWMYNGGTPNMSSLIKLSKFFGVSIDYLVFGEQKED